MRSTSSRLAQRCAKRMPRMGRNRSGKRSEARPHLLFPQLKSYDVEPQRGPFDADKDHEHCPFAVSIARPWTRHLVLKC